MSPSSVRPFLLIVSSGKLQSLTGAFKKAKCQTTNLPLKLQRALSLSHWRGGGREEEEGEIGLFGRRVNNWLCSGRLKLVSIDTCYLSADSGEELIKCKDADGEQPNNHHGALTSSYCCHVTSLTSAPPEPMMFCGAVTFQPPSMPREDKPLISIQAF